MGARHIMVRISLNASCSAFSQWKVADFHVRANNGRCRDSLLYFSSEGFDSGLELEVIDEQDKVGKSEEEDTDDERQDRELCGLQCGV